jgi:outer membrane protein TolC
LKKFTSLFLTSLLIYETSVSQSNTSNLTLQDAISSAIANNDAVKFSRLDEQIAKSKLKQTDAIFLPQINLSYTSLATNNPLNAFGFKLQQKSIASTDFDPFKLNHPSSTYDFTSKIELQQPVISLDLLYQRKAAAVQMEMYGLISKRTKEGLAFETEKAYLNLQWLYRVNDVMQQALNTSRSAYKSTKDYFEQGLIQKSDLLNAEVYVSNLETQIKQLQSNIEDASNMLSLLMGKPGGTVYTTDSIQMKPNIGIDSVSISDNRHDLQAMTKGIEAYDLLIHSSKMNYFPKLNAFASYQLNDNDAFGFKANSYLAGIQLSWNLFNGNRTKNTIAQQSFEKEKLTTQLKQKKEQDLVQMNHVRNTANDALYEINKRQVNVQQASEALRVLQNRYEQGLVKTTDILQSQTQLAEQKLGYVQAIYNYNIALATLSFLTNN